MEEELYQCRSSILLCAFNRPEKTWSVIQEIKKVRPGKLYFSCDGARNKDESGKVLSVRRLAGEIDWPCVIKTRFSETNLGCGQSVFEAIQWLFKNEEMGIVLEDDTLPSVDFFRFADEMLLKHRNNPSIGAICGTSLMPECFNQITGVLSNSSRYFYPWGWASWRRAVKDFEISPEAYCASHCEQILERNGIKGFEAEFWKTIFESAFNRTNMNTWDFQFKYHLWKKQMRCVHSESTLISNIGFDSEATHTWTSKEKSAPNEKLENDPIEWMEGLRFLNSFNKDWNGIGNVTAKYSIYKRMMEYKKELHKYRYSCSSPFKYFKYYLSTIKSKLFNYNGR